MVDKQNSLSGSTGIRLSTTATADRSDAFRSWRASSQELVWSPSKMYKRDIVSMPPRYSLDRRAYERSKYNLVSGCWSLTKTSGLPNSVLGRWYSEGCGQNLSQKRTRPRLQEQMEVYSLQSMISEWNDDFINDNNNVYAKLNEAQHTATTFSIEYINETVSLTKTQKIKLGVGQWAMDRNILDVKLLNRSGNTTRRSQTQIVDETRKAATLKRGCAGHVCPMPSELWGKTTTV